MKPVAALQNYGRSIRPDYFRQNPVSSNQQQATAIGPGFFVSRIGSIDLTRTLFIVSSKSGTTLEPNIFKQYLFEQVAQTVGREEAGRRFVAVHLGTDVAAGLAALEAAIAEAPSTA